MKINIEALSKVVTQDDIIAKRELNEALSYLKSTDWYVIRLVEEDTPIPTDVCLKRKEARQTINKEVK